MKFVAFKPLLPFSRAIIIRIVQITQKQTIAWRITHVLALDFAMSMIFDPRASNMHKNSICWLAVERASKQSRVRNFTFTRKNFWEYTAESGYAHTYTHIYRTLNRELFRWLNNKITVIFELHKKKRRAVARFALPSWTRILRACDVSATVLFIKQRWWNDNVKIRKSYAWLFGFYLNLSTHLPKISFGSYFA